MINGAVITEDEIGDILGISKARVRYYYKTAMKKIRRRLFKKFGADVLRSELYRARQKNNGEHI